MYNFDDLGKKISEIDERIDALIAKTGLSYSEFAVLYTLAKTAARRKKRSARFSPKRASADRRAKR